MHGNLKRLALISLLFLAGCASLPDNFEQTPSYTWHAPEETKMGAFFASKAPDIDGISGVRMLSEPRAAFLARYAFANQAEKTLDIQY